MRSAVFVRVLQIVVVQAVFPLAPAARSGVEAIDVSKRAGSIVVPYRDLLTSVREFSIISDYAPWVFRGPVVANQPSSLTLSTVHVSIALMSALTSWAILLSGLETPSPRGGLGASWVRAGTGHAGGRGDRCGCDTRYGLSQPRLIITESTGSVICIRWNRSGRSGDRWSGHSRRAFAYHVIREPVKRVGRMRSEARSGRR